MQAARTRMARGAGRSVGRLPMTEAPRRQYRHPFSSTRGNNPPHTVHASSESSSPRRLPIPPPIENWNSEPLRRWRPSPRNTLKPLRRRRPCSPPCPERGRADRSAPTAARRRAPPPGTEPATARETRAENQYRPRGEGAGPGAGRGRGRRRCPASNPAEPVAQQQRQQRRRRHPQL